MWVIRHYSLASSNWVKGPVLPCEQLQQMLTAQVVVAQAHDQARSLILDAQKQVEEHIAQATGEFLARAEQFFQELEIERRAAREEAVTYAEDLLRAGLQQLFEDTETQARAHAMLRLLTRKSESAVQGTLYCHPDIFHAVSEWVSTRPALSVWQVKVDNQVAPETLRLSSATGNFELGWSAVEQWLLGPGNP